MFWCFYLLWLSRCRHLYYKAEATANSTPPPPPHQLSASDSDPNLSWIPSSWSSWCAVPSAQMLCAAPTLTQACLDYLHPRWCNPVLGCRTSFLPSLFIFNLLCPGKVFWECKLFLSNLCSWSTQVSCSFKEYTTEIVRRVSGLSCAKLFSAGFL